MKYLFLIWSIFLLSGGYSETQKKDTKVDYKQILHDLSGHWVGRGYTLIAVPSFTNTDFGFDLKLFHTHETLIFSSIREQIRNAGNTSHSTIFLSALTYLQQITDLTTNEELHIEPGIWFYQPATKNIPEQLWRAGNIPHGNSFLAGSIEVKESSKGPEFEDVISLPFPQGKEEEFFSGDEYTAVYEFPTLPASMISKYSFDEPERNVVVHPAEFLKEDIANQNIYSTKTISISSIDPTSLGGVLNIPFLGVEANAAQVEATFYIEKVKEGEFTFWQLQYIQEIYLDFPVLGSTDQITWPHISVATLRKQAGEYVS